MSGKSKRNFMADITNIPNMLCLFRIMSIPVLVVFFYLGYHWGAVTLAFISTWTDFFDGRLARKLNMETDLGGLLDIVADLLFTCIVLFIAVEQGVWPIYLFILWAFRDLSVLAMRWSAAQLGFAIPSIMLGKVATVIIFIALVGFFLDVMQPFPGTLYNHYLHVLGLALIHIGLGLQWITALVYFFRYYQLYQEGY